MKAKKKNFFRFYATYQKKLKNENENEKIIVYAIEEKNEAKQLSKKNKKKILW